MSTKIGPATAAEVALRALTPAAGAVPFFDSATTADLLTATATELNYMAGVTSAVQAQLNAKQASNATLDAVAAGTYTGDDSITTVGTLGAGNATAIVDAATDIAAGKVELATDAETVTGTDTARAVTPANVAAKMAAPGPIGGTTPGAVTATAINLPEGGAVVWDGGDASLTQTGDVLAVAGATFKPATGTATMVPVKFTSGTVITVTEAGSVEFNGDIFYGTITTGAGTDFASQYPPAQTSTYVEATSESGSGLFEPEYATDPTKSLTGDGQGDSWVSGAFTTNQAFHIDYGTPITATRLYVENSHQSGGTTDAGVQNFTLWGSNNAAAFADTTYANDADWTQLTTASSVVLQHVASNVADPQYILITNSTGYRFYRLKFANNWGNVTYMGVTRIELQEGGSARKIIVMADGAALVAGRVPIVSTSGRLVDDADFTHDGDKLTTRVQLPAGSASLAPFGFTSGTFITTPIAGRVEFLTDDLAFTITTGTVRKIIAWVPAQTNVTGSRALNTTYTAPTTRSIMVTATVRCAISLAGGNAYAQGKSDGSTPPTTVASGKVGVEAGLLGEDNSFQISFVVAPGMKYRIDSSATNGTVTLGEWFEVSY